MLPGGVFVVDEAAVVYSYIVELFRLGRLGRLSGGLLARAYRLMGLLREAGFSSSEISLLSGGVWGADAVRKCAQWSGVGDVSKRNAVIELLAGFVAAGYDLKDVGEFRAARAQLDSVHMGFGDAVRIQRGALLAGGDVKKLADFSDEVSGANVTVKDLQARMKLDAELAGRGITRGVQESVLEEAKHFDSVDEYLKVIAVYPRVRKLIERKIRLEHEVGKLEEERASLDLYVNANKSGLEQLSLLYVAGWNLAHLMLLPFFTKKYGGMNQVFDAIKEQALAQGEYQAPGTEVPRRDIVDLGGLKPQDALMEFIKKEKEKSGGGEILHSKDGDEWPAKKGGGPTSSDVGVATDNTQADNNDLSLVEELAAKLANNPDFTPEEIEQTRAQLLKFFKTLKGQKSGPPS